MINENVNTSIKTKSGNVYFLCGKKKQLLIIHPLLGRIMNSFFNGENVENEMNGILNSNCVLFNGYQYSYDEVSYYYRKFLFLKDNGYFDKIQGSELLISEVSSNSLFDSLVNSNQLLFEVTEKCNLKCYYCAYGELYNKISHRKSGNLNMSIVESIVGYLIPFWEKKSLSEKRIINIYFYGGEPLLNAKLIKAIVFMFKEINIKGIEFKFGLTTNGLLLRENILFLLENDFNLTVSFDGNILGSKYRKYSSGIGSFDDLVRELDFVKAEYPSFFDKNISFLSVLHNSNSVETIDDFIYSKYHKTSSVSELSMIGLNPDRRNDFEYIYKSNLEHLSDDECCFINGMKYISKKEGVRLILMRFNLGIMNAFYSACMPCNAKRMMSGTCFPFTKKIFVSTKGFIYPCEKISHDNFFGNINENGVNLDFNNMADKYNSFFCKMQNLCMSCYNNQFCTQCLFDLDLKNDIIICGKYLSKEDYSFFLNTHIGYLEDFPMVYGNIINNLNSIV